MYILIKISCGRNEWVKTFKTKQEAKLYAKNDCESIYKGILEWNTGNSIEYGNLRYTIRLY